MDWFAQDYPVTAYPICKTADFLIYLQPSKTRDPLKKKNKNKTTFVLYVGVYSWLTVFW